AAVSSLPPSSPADPVSSDSPSPPHAASTSESAMSNAMALVSRWVIRVLLPVAYEREGHRLAPRLPPRPDENALHVHQGPPRTLTPTPCGLSIPARTCFPERRFSACGPGRRWGGAGYESS